MNAMGTRGGLLAAERDASVTLGIERDASVTLGIECDASATFETGSVAVPGLAGLGPPTPGQEMH
jgi:hypothetical protein